MRAARGDINESAELLITGAGTPTKNKENKRAR
jgi:hypothetical protein